MSHGAFNSPKPCALEDEYREAHELQQTAELQQCQRPNELPPEVELQLETSCTQQPREVCPGVLLGTTAQAKTCARDVSHVIVCDESLPHQLCGDQSCVHVPLLAETVHEVCYHLGTAVSTLQAALKGGGRVLVVSKSGLSSSVAVVVAYLMVTQSLSCFEAYVALRKVWIATKLVPGLKSGLLLFEQEHSARRDCVMQPLADRVLLERRPQPNDGSLTCTAAVLAVGPEVTSIAIGDLVLIPKDGGEKPPGHSLKVWAT